VYAATILGLAAFVLIGVIGAQEQRDRRIGGVTSASLQRWDGQLRPPLVRSVQVGRAEANRLARMLNALPRPPSGESHCGEMLGRSYGVRFAVDHGSNVTVNLADGGCLGVDARSDGQWWGWDKWDRDGTARAEIARDLQTGDHRP
jgi:hypothetical protein